MMKFEEQHLRELGLYNRKFLELPEIEAKKEIKKAFYKMSKKFHPDTWTEELGLTREQGEAKFKKVLHAYKMLTDPSYRNQESQKKENLNLDAVFQIHIPMEQALFGKKVTMTINPTYVDKNGQVVTLEDSDSEIELDVDVFEVEAKPSTAHNSKQIFKGRGMILKDEDGEERRGNAVFVFLVKPHPKYRYCPEESYIETDLDVALETMLKGGFVEVETPWGLQTLEVDPGTSPGQTYEINRLGHNKDYKLGIVIRPIYPEKDELKKRGSIWEKMGIKFKEEESESERTFIEMDSLEDIKSYWDL